jgi:adenylate cyclase
MAAPHPDRLRSVRRWLVPVAAVLLVAAFHQTPFGRALDRALFDAQSRRPVRAPAWPETPSALVLIDDNTMDVLGREPWAMRWPFPRVAFAGLIAALDRAGAAKIVVDLTFVDHAEAAEQDLVLGSVAAAARETILASSGTQRPVFWDDAFVSGNASLFPAPRTGDVTFHADDDGVARGYFPAGSLAEAALGRAAGRGEGLLRWHGGVQDLQARFPEKVPVLSAARFFVRGIDIVKRLGDAVPDLAPQDVARALAAEPALTGEGFDAVKGRVVFVGASAAGTFDLKAMPVGDLQPAVLLHWTAWTNLATGGLVAAVPRWVSLVAGGVLALVIFAAWRVRPGLTLAASVAAVAVVALLGGAYAGVSCGWFFAPMTPVMAAGVTLLGISAESFWRERERKREIQAMFGSYVAPSVVERLVRDPQAIRLGGERREATVFFSDLAGFTDLSEKITPELLLEIINRYLEETSDSLLAHGAYIDKYIGDAVMAVFGVPQPLPDHATAACAGALAAAEAFARFSDDIAQRHGHRPRMRIGINTGAMIVGNLGSERKKNYTVLGDPVNLASRLEGANKEFGTSILLGETTAALVQATMITRPLGRLRVKGKTEAVEVHELIGRAGAVDTKQMEFLATYRDGYRRYVARDFAGAAAALTRAQACAPAGERVTMALLERANALVVRPPDATWEPILTLDSK